MGSAKEIKFLQWALPQMGYRWPGFRKPRRQVIKRVRNRMQELGLTGGYEQYKTYLKTNPSEWEKLDKLCDVTISKFFRDRRLWDYLRDDLMKNLLYTEHKDDLHIWSAGCCNGEEPYSIAIVVEMISKKRPVSILASDRNREVLSRARKGHYPAGALSELTGDEIRTYFSEKDDQDNDYRICNRLKQNVELEWRDICESLPEQTFDLIFCRNLVFTYFAKPEQELFISKLKPNIKHGGFLIIGSNEILPETEWLESYHKSHPVYRRV